ncbi:MAG: hypothetical protein IKK84_04070 [Clostridia bacterium]|nr:hypothetical protein [Clostridia bacterium]
MQKKKGISLIVLSITILVMAILAATAIIALEDSGIIKRSRDTVKNSNYSDEYTRLMVIKNGILTDNLGTITVDEYITELTNKGLIENTIITNDDDSKTITTKTGFKITISQSTASDLTLEFESDNDQTSEDNTTSTLISFTIDGVEYQAEAGMTWLQWIDSEYNTIGATSSNAGEIIRYSNGIIKHSTGGVVSGIDQITNLGNYTTSADVPK